MTEKGGGSLYIMGTEHEWLALSEFQRDLEDLHALIAKLARDTDALLIECVHAQAEAADREPAYRVGRGTEGAE